MGSHDRRGFLRGLASLPLIGGSVALVGSPTRAAVFATDDQLALYACFALDEVQEVLCHFQAAGRSVDGVLTGARRRHDLKSLGAAGLQSRALVILSAAGVPITGGAHV